MICPVIDLFTEIRDLLAENRTLAHKRAVKAAQQARYRANKRASVVDTTQDVDTTKEDEKGKETFPPAPPIEKREKQKKGAGEGEDARAREVSSDVLQANRKREARVAKVADYNAELGGDIDAEYFVDYYADHWPHDWRARLRNWLKEDKPAGRIAPVVKAGGGGAERSPRPTDWTLCAERCANCRDNGCSCGIAIPPDCEVNPRPPEECPRFNPIH